MNDLWDKPVGGIVLAVLVLFIGCWTGVQTIFGYFSLASGGTAVVAIVVGSWLMLRGIRRWKRKAPAAPSEERRKPIGIIVFAVLLLLMSCCAGAQTIFEVHSLVMGVMASLGIALSGLVIFLAIRRWKRGAVAAPPEVK